MSKKKKLQQQFNNVFAAAPTAPPPDAPAAPASTAPPTADLLPTPTTPERPADPTPNVVAAAKPPTPNLAYQASAQGLANVYDWTSPEAETALQKGQMVVRDGAEAATVATLAVPIRLPQQTLGVLSFSDESAERVWSEDDMALVQAVTDQLALALENARLFQETRDYLNKQTLLYEVTRAAASAANLTDALQGAATALSRVLPDSDIAILLLEPRTRQLRARAVVGVTPRDWEDLLIPVGEGITGWVAEHNQALLVSDVRQETRYRSIHSNILSEAAVPLALGDRVIGVLNVESPRANAFNESDLQLLSTLAGTLSAIIVNNNLLEEITRERERLSVLYEVLQAFITRPDRDAIITTALGLASRLGAQFAYLMLLGDTEKEASFYSNVPGLDWYSPRQSRDLALRLAQKGLEQWVLANRRPVLISDTLEDGRWQQGPVVRSVVSVPLQTQRGTLTGVLGYTHTQSNIFTEDQVPLIESIGGQVAAALENVRLRTQQATQEYNATALAKAAQALTRSLEENELNEILAQQLFEAFHANGVIIARWENATDTFKALALRISENENPADQADWPKFGESFPGTNRPDYMEAFNSQLGQVHVVREVSAAEVRETMIMPLLHGGDAEGVAEVVCTGPITGLTLQHQELCEAIINAWSTSLQSARLYELQRQTAERLAEVDRLKSQFLANMSHELRTPLNSIIGFSRVILKGIDGPLTDLQIQDLTSINNAGQHLLGLINSILDLAKIEAGKMELVFDEVNLYDTIKIVMSTALALVKDKHLELKQDVESDLPTVRADAMRLRQILLNLLSNASKFTDEGSITLRVRKTEAMSPQMGRLEPYVEMSVIDTGMGIAPEDMGKLFEAFSQVDASATRKVGGTGLGLNICRHLIELHNGRVWVESEINVGTTFTFIIPISQPEKAAETTPDGGKVDSDRIVLAVDDDQGVMTLYRRYLEPHGYKVVGVNKSTEVITRAAELTPMVILLDVLMPHKDGWQVLSELKRSDITRNIPVVMCTLVTDRERAMSMGALDYLSKPILESDLMRVLTKISLKNGRKSKAPQN